MKIIQLGGKAGTSHFERGINFFFKKAKLNFRLNFGLGKGNAGDTAIGTAFKYLFKLEFPGDKIHFMNCRKIFTYKDINYINKFGALFLSGGGLFLYDSFQNTVSDWQWGISKQLLNRINIPIIVYSVGYNKFRKQLDFNNHFNETVSKLLEKSIFFGIRNIGSCNAIKKHVDKRLHKYIKLNYCPTLLLNKKYKYRNTLDNGTVGFLFAGDRLKNRHENIDRFINQMKRFVKYLRNKNITTIRINHAHDGWIDRYIEFDKYINFNQKNTRFIYNNYSKIDLVVGDRGHSQMIPFACGCKILTPVSHDKLKWFLSDMNLSEFGIEENDNELSEKLIDQFNKLNNINWDRIQKERMQMIYKTNRNNLEFIKQRLQEEEMRR